MEKPAAINVPPEESIDTAKLLSVLRKNKFWIILILVFSNTFAYLTIRWTKDLFESESEMKLDIKQDTRELGLKSIVEDQNANKIAGEIEQIKSKVFFNRVIDSLDIWISYYSVGNILKDEMYKRSPFIVHTNHQESTLLDLPIYLYFVDEETYKIKISDDEEYSTGLINKPIEIRGEKFVIDKTKFFETDDTNEYYFILNSRTALSNYLSKNSYVTPLKLNANTIRVSFQDNNALKAFDIVNTMDSLYIDYSNEQKNLANRQKIEWLNNELAQVEKRMQDFETYFENFTLDNKSSDLTQDLRIVITKIHSIDSQQYILDKKIALLNGTIDQLNSNNHSIQYQQRDFLPDYLNKMVESLNKIKQDRDRLELAYNENTFAFRLKDKELKSINDLVFEQLAELKKQWLKEYAELKQTKEKLENRFSGLPEKNTQFAKNQRFYKLYEEFYFTMMQSKAQFEIAQAGNTPDFKILSPAFLPTIPISPKKYLILGIGLVAGIILNFFFIGIIYLLNNKITSVQEIESALHLPLLGVIPMTNRKLSAAFHVVENPKSMVSEAIRTLRTNLDFFSSSATNKIITITSTISGEGKSFLAANLSGVLAMSRKKVLLIDLDMRKLKKEISYEGIDRSKGISTVLIKKNLWTECIQKTEIDNLDFLPAGPHPPNPSELLLNGEFTTLLDELKKTYDFIVIDTPPIGLVTDGIMAMKKSDLSIYVMRANYSKKEFLINIKRIETIHKFKGLSIVLNALSSSGKSYGYGYYEEKQRAKSWKNLFQ